MPCPPCGRGGWRKQVHRGGSGILLIHQRKPAADMRNDAPRADTREKREGGEAGAHLSPRPRRPLRCRGSEAGEPGGWLLGGPMPTGRPHVSCVPVSMHRGMDHSCQPDSALGLCLPLILKLLPLPASMIMEPKLQGVPERRRPQPFGHFLRPLYTAPPDYSNQLHDLPKLHGRTTHPG